MQTYTDANGNQWRVDHGFNLYIDVLTACNASCAFCIAPTAERRDGPGFFAGAEEALTMTAKIGGTVQIVGGEPTISNRLPGLFDMIGERRYRRVVLNTNASKLTPSLIERAAGAGVTHVNISRHHYDELRNQSIMYIRPHLPNERVAEAIVGAQQTGMKVRMQCNLIRGEVDNWQDMQRYMEWCTSMGCGEVSFSQVFPLSLFDYQRPISWGYTERVQIDLRSLVREIHASPLFRLVSDVEIEQYVSRHGGSPMWGSGANEGKRRFWDGPDGFRFSIKTLSGWDDSALPGPTTYDKANDPELQEGVLAFAVCHTDGRVTASWDRRERVLYQPSERIRDKDGFIINELGIRTEPGTGVWVFG